MADGPSGLFCTPLCDPASLGAPGDCELCAHVPVEPGPRPLPPDPGPEGHACLVCIPVIGVSKLTRVPGVQVLTLHAPLLICCVSCEFSDQPESGGGEGRVFLPDIAPARWPGQDPATQALGRTGVGPGPRGASVAGSCRQSPRAPPSRRGTIRTRTGPRRCPPGWISGMSTGGWSSGARARQGGPRAMAERGWLTGWGESPRSVPCGAKVPACGVTDASRLSLCRGPCFIQPGERRGLSPGTGGCVAPPEAVQGGSRGCRPMRPGGWACRAPRGAWAGRCLGPAHRRRQAPTGGPDSHGACGPRGSVPGR